MHGTLKKTKRNDVKRSRTDAVIVRNEDYSRDSEHCKYNAPKELKLFHECYEFEDNVAHVGCSPERARQSGSQSQAAFFA